MRNKTICIILGIGIKYKYGCQKGFSCMILTAVDWIIREGTGVITNYRGNLVTEITGLKRDETVACLSLAHL